MHECAKCRFQQPKKVSCNPVKQPYFIPCALSTSQRQRPPSDQIYEASPRSATLLLNNLPLSHGDSPLSLASGPLLGVSVRRASPAACDLLSGESTSNLLQFYRWGDSSGGSSSYGRVGDDLPEPMLISWDPSLSFAALAYSSQVVVSHQW